MNLSNVLLDAFEGVWANTHCINEEKALMMYRLQVDNNCLFIRSSNPSYLRKPNWETEKNIFSLFRTRLFLKDCTFIDSSFSDLLTFARLSD